MTNDAVLSGTVALVTGASSGIGEATAKRLAADGATVAVAARRLDRLEKLVEEIDDAGGKALAIEADVTDRAAAEALVERTVKDLGRLDTVVNNAGVMLLGPSLDADIEEWDRMIDINVKGLLYVAKAALPPLINGADEGPRLVTDMVNISSVAGRRAREGSAVYNATKFRVGVCRRRFPRGAQKVGPGAPRARLAGRAGCRNRGAGEPQSGRGAGGNE